MTDDVILRNIFERYRAIAVYGMSTNEAKPAHTVPAFLKARGYSIIPVNPFAETILGLKAYPDLASVPGRIDIVEVFRPSGQALAVTQEAVARRREKGDVSVIWLQQGIINDDARELAESAEIIFVQDRCMYKDYVRLIN